MSDDLCPQPKPTTTQSCNDQPCTYAWVTGDFGACSVACGGGVRTRSVTCQGVETGDAVADSFCTDPKPPAQDACNTQPCN